MLNFIRAFPLLCVFSTVVVASEPEQWLIEQGDIKISATEFVNAIQSMAPPEVIDRVLSDPEQSVKALLEMYQYKLLAAEGKALNLDKEPLFAAKIEYATTRSLANEYLKHYVGAQSKPDFVQAAREHYKLNKEKFKLPERVHAQHILIKVAERSDAEALALAEQVRSKISKKGENFADLAVEFSEDPSVAQNKGDLGFFAHGTMVPEFSNAAFGMKKGEISQPVKSNFGYHLIRVLGHEESSYTDFNKVKSSIIEQLAREYDAKIRDERISRLQENIPQINESLLKQLKR